MTRKGWKQEVGKTQIREGEQHQTQRIRETSHVEEGWGTAYDFLGILYRENTVTPISQVRKLRLREVKYFQSHRSSNRVKMLRDLHFSIFLCSSVSVLTN